MSGLERRGSPRVPVHIEVDYRASDTFLFAYITDISALGIFVRTDSPDAPGTHLFLRFTPPGGAEPLELEGEVIWINPYLPEDPRHKQPGMGIRFIAPTGKQCEILLDLVRTFAYLDEDDGANRD